MGTPLDAIYKRFCSKVNEDLTGKEELIFEIMNSAKSKIYKACNHSLNYTITNEETYEGYFNDILDDDEIELWALQMLYEWKRRRKEQLEGQRKDIGTSDFNKLPNKVEELKQLGVSMKDLKEEINDLKNEFNTYKYN